ncbi:hypothetical protein [Sphingosinicella terrae]|uniref:hypothetical protein n=1 Tax=Sphingosinicella terrae TaxID=2172047 RepID=UPI000E0DD6D5|nr:hypothetical protein [Sphingosinicella terrae]
MMRTITTAACAATMLRVLAGCGTPAENSTAGAAEAPSTAPADSADPAAPDARSTAVPQRFLGIWDVSPAACAGAPGEMRLVVGADQLRFHESVAAVRAVRSAERGAVAMELELEGEGERWRETRRLRLLPHGRLEVEVGGTGAVRVRCSEGANTVSAPAWEAAAGSDGATLYLPAPDGGRAVTFFCPRGSGDLLVNVTEFHPVESEERMSVGSGGTVVVLVADTAGDGERGGVSGRSVVPAELEAILGGGEGIAINYGAQNSGPHPRPPAALGRRFAAGCRA